MIYAFTATNDRKYRNIIIIINCTFEIFLTIDVDTVMEPV
jgi:hypothetical protein